MLRSSLLWKFKKFKILIFEESNKDFFEYFLVEKHTNKILQKFSSLIFFFDPANLNYTLVLFFDHFGIPKFMFSIMFLWRKWKSNYFFIFFMKFHFCWKSNNFFSKNFDILKGKYFLIFLEKSLKSGRQLKFLIVRSNFGLKSIFL